MGRCIAILAILSLAGPAWAETKQIIGSTNPNLAKGARALLAGRHEEGIRLTHLGLEEAESKRHEEIALSNLCSGYTNNGDYETAMQYCDLVIQRNDRVWQAFNTKALIYIYTKQYAKAEVELEKGEAINPNARTMKIARALYEDAVNPVAPVIEADDRPQREQ